MTLPAVDPILQWYKNNPPYCQVVKLTSNSIPNASYSAFTNFSNQHGFVLNKGYKTTTVPYANSSGTSI